MNRIFQAKRSLVLLALAALLTGGLIFSWASHPVMASPMAQAGTVTGTGTVTVTSTVTNTVGSGTGTPTRSQTPSGSTTPTLGGTSGAGTATRTPTATQSFFTFRTPTLLSPVTGGEMSDGEAPPNAGTWAAIWLLGLLLVGYGVWAKMSRR